MIVREVLEEKSQDDLKLWLVSGFRDHDWEGVEFDHAPGIPVQIHAEFEEVSARAQEKLRRAVIHAIAEWSPARPAMLGYLCELAAYVQASRVGPVLRELILSKLADREEDPQFRRLTGVAVATLCGLASAPEAGDAVEALFFSDEVNPRYAAQLLRGMIALNPRNYPRYLPRFVELAARHEKHFRLDVIFDAVLEEITPSVFAEHFEELDKQTVQLLEILLPKVGIYYDWDKRKIISGVDETVAILAVYERKFERRHEQQDLERFLEPN